MRRKYPTRLTTKTRIRLLKKVQQKDRRQKGLVHNRVNKENAQQKGQEIQERTGSIQEPEHELDEVVRSLGKYLKGRVFAASWKSARRKVVQKIGEKADVSTLVVKLSMGLSKRKRSSAYSYVAQRKK